MKGRVNWGWVSFIFFMLVLVGGISFGIGMSFKSARMLKTDSYRTGYEKGFKDGKAQAKIETTDLQRSTEGLTAIILKTDTAASEKIANDTVEALRGMGIGYAKDVKSATLRVKATKEKEYTSVISGVKSESTKIIITDDRGSPVINAVVYGGQITDEEGYGRTIPQYVSEKTDRWLVGYNIARGKGNEEFMRKHNETLQIKKSN